MQTHDRKKGYEYSIISGTVGVGLLRSCKRIKMNPFNHVFRTGTIGKIEVKNRLLMAPMTTLYATNESEVTDRMIDYYVERANGGVGAIIVEATYIDPGGQRFSNNLAIHDERFLPGLGKLADRVKQAGAKIFIQLCHGGRECVSSVTGQPLVGPSAIPSPYRGIAQGAETPKALTKGEIRDIIENFFRGAERAQRSGFDGIELHGAHGYLISQFLSPYCNKRTDEYGGDIDGRTRFVGEILDLIKKRLPDFPIIVRFNGEDAVPGGNTIEDTGKIAAILAQKGADVLHISSGFHESRPYRVVPNMSVKKMCYAPLAAQIKQTVHIPVITVGRITEPVEAESVLREGTADFVALGRALIVDPQFPHKALTGKINDIRKCLGCNQGCIDMCHKKLPITCVYNPAVGAEKEAQMRAAENPKRVAVLGGGPAGMEAAYISAKRGHKVDLYEKKELLGGQLRAAIIPPTRGEISSVIGYLEDRLRKWNVNIHLNTEVNKHFLMDLQADEMIMATGSDPILPEFPRSDHDVFMAEDVLLSKVKPKEGRVAVIGGGLVGCETADFLAEQGNSVVLFEMLDEICGDAGTATRVYLYDKLKALKVVLLTGARVVKIEDKTIHYHKDDVQTSLSDVDATVISVGYKPNRGLKDVLDRKGIQYHQVGDCREVGNALESIHNAFWAALEI